MRATSDREATPRAFEKCEKCVFRGSVSDVQGQDMCFEIVLCGKRDGKCIVFNVMDMRGLGLRAISRDKYW